MDKIILFFTLDGIGRIFGFIDREMDSSSALDSYEPLLSNAPSVATTRAVCAKIQHERSARNLDFLKVKMRLVGFSITVGKYTVKKGFFVHLRCSAARLLWISTLVLISRKDCQGIDRNKHSGVDLRNTVRDANLL